MRLPDPPAVATGPSACRTVARAVVLIAAPIAGVALAAAMLVGWLIPTVGLGGVDRIRQLGRHLDAPRDGRPTAVVLGDSVAMEGVDAALVEASAPPGWTVENLAIEDCQLTEQLVLLPKLLRSKPAAVVFVLDAAMVTQLACVPPDKGYAYALAGFVDCWPADWTQADLPGLRDGDYAALRSSRVEQFLHFRAAPLTALNLRARAAARSDIRSVESDWRSPHELLSPFAPDAMAHHVQSLRKSLLTREDSAIEKVLDLLERVIQMSQDCGARCVVVIAPVHPEVRDLIEPALPYIRERFARLESTGGIRAIDGSNALEPGQFADALHATAEGRAVLSELVGRALPPVDAASATRLANAHDERNQALER